MKPFTFQLHNLLPFTELRRTLSTIHLKSTETNVSNTIKMPHTRLQLSQIMTNFAAYDEHKNKWLIINVSEFTQPISGKYYPFIGTKEELSSILKDYKC